MIKQLSEYAQNLDHDFVGRIVAYGGGSTGIAYTKVANVVQESAVYDWGYWMFGAAIFGRLIFDVVKYFRAGK